MEEYATETPGSTRTADGPVKRWMVEHEDRPSFLVLYVTAAVVLSIVISLFWLAVVVAFHLLFEIMRFSAHETRTPRIFKEALWEVKLDLSLILLALALAVYIHAVFGILGLSTAARAAGVGARFAVLQRAIRGILISIDDGLLVMRGALKRLSGRKAQAASPEEDHGPSPAGPDAAEEGTTKPLPAAAASHAHDAHAAGHGADDRPSWRRKWNLLDWTAVAIGVASITLIAAAPLLTGHTYPSAFHEIWDELHPWPADSPMQGMIDRSLAWIRS